MTHWVAAAANKLGFLMGIEAVIDDMKCRRFLGAFILPSECVCNEEDGKISHACTSANSNFASL